MARFNPCMDASAAGAAPAPAPAAPKTKRTVGARKKATLDLEPFRAQSDTMVALMLGQCGADPALVQSWRKAFEAYCAEHPELKNWRTALSSFGLTLRPTPAPRPAPAPEPTVAARWAAAEQAQQKLEARKSAPNNVLVIPVADWQRSEPVAVPVVAHPPVIPHLTIKRWGLPSWRRV